MQPKKSHIHTIRVGCDRGAGCERNGRVTNDPTSHFEKMKPNDDLMPEFPASPKPDTLLEVKEDGYLVDGKQIDKLSLPDELARAAGRGRKVIEIRGSDSISAERMEYVFEVLGGSGFEEILLTSTDATIRKGK